MAFSSQFAIDVVHVGTAHVPTPSSSTIIQEPSYLHAIFRSFSLGHMLRDNLPAVVANLDDLGLPQYMYQIVVFSQVLPKSAYNPGMILKYGKLAAHASLLWNTLLHRTNTRFMLFQDVVVGSFLFQYHPLRIRYKVSPPPPRSPSRESILSRFGGRDWDEHTLFKLTRDVGYAGLGMGVVGNVRDHRPFKVLFGNKGSKDKRRIDNIPVILPELRAQFQNIQFESVLMHELTAHQQLMHLETTSIFISPVRSPALSVYSGVFLPSSR